MKIKLAVFSFLIILINFFIPTLVQASTTFYESEYIPSLWVNKEKDNRIRYQQARFLRRGGDNQFAYCIEPWSEISSTVNYDDLIDINTLDDETLERISLIAYYGYGYGNHQDSKWYYITQVLIWREVDKSASFYFTNKLNGTQISTYDQQMNEILNLVKTHQKTPNFYVKEINLMLGTKGTIIDVNNVLSTYEIVNHPDNVILNKQGNSINIDTVKLGDSSFDLIKKDKIYQVAPIVYRHPINQNFLTVGSFKPMSTTIPVHITGGNIVIEKLDSDTNSSTPLGEANLLGSTFEIYNSANELVKSVTLETSTTATISDLKADTYTIKEIRPGTGYQVNTETYTVKLDNFNTKKTVEFKNKVIKNNIIIEKFYGRENGPWTKEEGVIFEIYNSNNILVTEITTNNEGIASTTLPYGTYLVKQKNSKTNYEKIEDFNIFVTTDKEEQVFKKYNKERLGKIILIKLDADTNSTIRNNSATFTLINKDTKEEIGTYQTNEDGVLTINDLSFASYQLKEIKVPEGYEQKETVIDFTIDENKQELVLEVFNKKEEIKEIIPPEKEIHYEVEVPNTNIIQIDIEKEISDDPKKHYNLLRSLFS